MKEHILFRQGVTLIAIVVACLLVALPYAIKNEEGGTRETEARASILLQETYPHDLGYTYGISCYAPPNWCNATVIHPEEETKQLSIYCGDKQCRFEE